MFVGIIGMGFIVVIFFFIMNNMLIVMIDVLVIVGIDIYGMMREVFIYVNVIGLDLGFKIMLIGFLVILLWFYVFL